MAPSTYFSYAPVSDDNVPPHHLVHEQPSQEELRKPVAWKIGWKAPVTMLFLLISGILTAAGHHCFNSFLSGKDVQAMEIGNGKFAAQIWIQRYGTVFAFLSKILLASSVTVAYKQHMWTILISRENSISTINAIFSATQDFLALLHPRLAMRASTSALMALVIWCLPLAAVVTPSTLLVVPANQTTPSLEIVPSVNLTDSGRYLFSGLGQANASPLITRITTSAASNMEILPMPAIDKNMTYSLEFSGPSLKCEAATGIRLQNMTDIWTATERAISGSASGKLQYLAYTLYESPEGNPTSLYANATDYVHQCIITRDDTRFSGDCITNSPSSLAISAKLEGESTVCFIHNTTFMITFTAFGNTQTITHYSYDHHEVLNDIISRTLSRAITTILNGAIGTSVSGPVGHQADNGRSSLNTFKTRIMETALIGVVSTAYSGQWGSPLQDLAKEDKQLARNRTLDEMIEELSRNQTLSLFSSPRLWSDNGTMAEVTRDFFYTKYQYQKRNLMLSYGIAIAASTACVLLGFRALWVNGVSHDTNFFSIMATTRNASLDRLTLGHSLGAEPVPDSVLKKRLRFGVLGNIAPEEYAAAGKVTRAGFGFKEEVQLLKKGQALY